MSVSSGLQADGTLVVGESDDLDDFIRQYVAGTLGAKRECWAYASLDSDDICGASPKYAAEVVWRAAPFGETWEERVLICESCLERNSADRRVRSIEARELPSFPVQHLDQPNDAASGKP